MKYSISFFKDFLSYTDRRTLYSTQVNVHIYNKRSALLNNALYENAKDV